MQKKFTIAALLLINLLTVHAYAQVPDTAHKTTLHTGNTLCPIDIDGDGDYDYLDGNISYSDVQLMINGKKDYHYYIDSMVSQDTSWQSNGHVMFMPQWPAPFWLDIDQDGAKDVVVTPHAPNSSENVKCFAWYRNEGSDAAPNFVYKGDSLISNKTIDVGTGSAPMFFDYDKDGKPDLFIGSDGYYQSNGSLKSKISYYQNTSTPGNPSFTLVTDDFLNISAQNFMGANLAFGDIDFDGKADMIIGHNNGTLSFYKNMAASASVQPQWQLQQANILDNNSAIISVQAFAAPFIYDINNDGKNDLIIGCQRGTVYYYKNITTVAGALLLQYDTSKLGNIKVDPSSSFTGNSTPFIGRLNNTPKDYLLIGSTTGELYRYDDFQNGSGIFTRIDSFYSNILDGQRSAPAVADVDGDGIYELVMGNTLGGLTLFKQSGNSYVQDSSIHVFANGVQKTNAWSGGFNNPQLCMADLNKDGKMDLITYEQSTMQVKTFLNIGNADYRYYPDYAKLFPPQISNYLKMEDYNRDGITDLIHSGITGFEVYKGSYNAQNQLTFTYYKNLFYTSPNGLVNAYVQPSDIPAILDIDGDGDLDFMSYAVLGANIAFYMNRQVEEGLPKDSIKICLVDNCWGKSNQLYQREQILHISCDPSGTTCSYPLGVEEHNLAAASCKIFPNPATNILHITWNKQFSGNENVEIVLYNVTGQKVYSTSAKNTLQQLDIPLQKITATGIYICEIQAGVNKIVQRVSVIK